MKITKRKFGTMLDGSQVNCWHLVSDNGMELEVLDYGVTIRSMLVPDKHGDMVDVILGYDTLEEYLTNGGAFGATIGRFANRIKDGAFVLNDQVYQLAKNGGKHHIHGGVAGFHKRVWESEAIEDGVVFSRISPDGEEGYPGTMQIQVTVSLKNNGMELKYHAVSDKDTIVNLTNHSYFNLSRENQIENQFLKINADRFTVNDADCMPTGEVVKVEGTAMDFRNAHPIGTNIDKEEVYVALPGGYDANFILNASVISAYAYAEDTGIAMTMITDQPGVQLYTANHIKERNGKNGKRYGHRCGFCLETQHFPDGIHHPQWPSCILRAGESFDSVTSYNFSIRRNDS